MEKIFYGLVDSPKMIRNKEGGRGTEGRYRE